MQWYHGAGGQKSGPFGQDDFVRLIETGVVTETTLVWRAGMAEWRPFAEVKAEFAPPAGMPPLDASPGAPAAPVTEASQPNAPVEFEFTGRAGEYFKIWIVNLLLTIVTLGIYAAWAKVRNRQYFYANTRLLGHAFNYTGNPVRILVGNCIVLGMALVYFMSGAISPLLLLPVILLFMILAPWLVVKSLSFNARNSAYRGLRFGFGGTYGQAAKVYVGLPILSVFTLHLLWPWVLRRQRQFVVDGHRYGATAFAFGGMTAELYKIFGRTLLFFLPLLVTYGGIIVMAIMAKSAGRASAAMGMFGLLILPAMIGALLGAAYFRAKLFNFIWNNVSVGRHRFAADMSFTGLLGLQFVNVLAVTFTLGLMYPWAKVRQTAFTLKSLQFLPQGGIDDLTGAARSAGEDSAVGDSAADFFDFDIGLGA